MKYCVLTVTIAALAFSLSASAQEQTAPAPASGMTVESVIVTAPKDRPEKQLDDFIIAHAAPSPYLRKIARWKTGICPLTIGLPPELSLYVNQRILRVAVAVGAPLASNEPCRPNVIVAATPQPQAVLDMVREKRPVLLGYHYTSREKQLATMTRMVQAWYSTATEDFYGFVEPDGGGYNLSGLDAMQSLGGFFSVHVSGSRVGDGLKSQFTTAMIIVDSSKIGGQPIGPLADYIAMLALGQGQYYDECQPVPTITNFLAPKCESPMKPAGLTDIDMTYLRGLYHMSSGGSYMLERAHIAFAMKKELGGY
jgi:hypothetical protein